jgi:hypothetical protein
MGDSLCFGLIADIQHADKVIKGYRSSTPLHSQLLTAAPFQHICVQDTVSFDDRPQRYRESRGKLQAALQDFASTANQQFVLTLGDIIDGYPLADDPQREKTSADLQLISGMFDSLLLAGRAVHHVLGNHCLAANRAQLLQVRCAVLSTAVQCNDEVHACVDCFLTQQTCAHARQAALAMCAGHACSLPTHASCHVCILPPQVLRMPGSYYSVDLSSSWRLIVLDTTEMSLHSGYPEVCACRVTEGTAQAVHSLKEYTY